MIYINKELLKYSHLTNAVELYDFVSPMFEEGSDNYLMIDEVQDIEGYENALRSLHAEGRCQIIATGSNAYIFSSELSTRLAGRYVEIPVYGLSYRNLLSFMVYLTPTDLLSNTLRLEDFPDSGYMISKMK